MSRTSLSLVLFTFASASLLAACVGPTPVGNERFQKRGSALTVSPTPIGTEAPVPVKYNTGDYMSVASSADEHLLAFYDGGRIRGLRYDEEGRVLDLDPWISLGRNDDTEGAQAYTDLAYGDGVYLVVYSDGSDTAPGFYAQAISSDGNPASGPTLIDAQSGYGSVIFNGTDFTVAYYDGDINLVRVGLDGGVDEASKTAVTTGSVTNRPVLALGEGVGLVLFEQAKDGAERKVYAARFTPEGQVLDPGGFLVSDTTTSSVDVSVAAGSNQFLAVWGGPAGAIRGSLIDLDGNVTRREFQISTGNNLATGGSAVAYDGTHFGVVWSNQESSPYAIVGTRIDAAGDRVDANDVPVAPVTQAGQSWALDLIWSEDHYTLVYRNDGIDGRFLGADLVPTQSAPHELSVLPSAQYISNVVFDGSVYVRGFTHEPGEATDIEFRVSSVDPAGTLLTEEAELIGDSPDGEYLSGYGLASSGQSTLLTYGVSGEERKTYLRVRDANGTLSSPEEQAWLDGTSLRLTSNGHGYLGLFDAGENENGNPVEIWGQVFDGAGARSGDPFLIQAVERPRYGLVPAGDGYLLVYSGQEIDGTPITGSVLSLSSEGQVLKDHGPVVEGMQSTTAASNGEHALFVWTSDETESLLGRLLDSDAGWSEPFEVAAAHVQSGSAVAWDGEQFAVAWPDSRQAMMGRNVAIDGTMSPPEELFLGDCVSPTLVAGDDGQLLLSYVRYGEWSRYRRVESRIIGDLGETVLPEDGATTSEGSTSTGETTSSDGTTDGDTDIDTDSGTQTSGTTEEVEPNAPQASSEGRGSCAVSHLGGDREGGLRSALWLIGLLAVFGARGRRATTRT